MINDNEEYEHHILKWISFLNVYHDNQLLAFYELNKMVSKIKEPSYFFQHITSLINARLQLHLSKYNLNPQVKLLPINIFKIDKINNKIIQQF